MSSTCQLSPNHGTPRKAACEWPGTYEMYLGQSCLSVIKQVLTLTGNKPWSWGQKRDSLHVKAQEIAAGIAGVYNFSGLVSRKKETKKKPQNAHVYQDIDASKSKTRISSVKCCQGRVDWGDGKSEFRQYEPNNVSVFISQQTVFYSGQTKKEWNYREQRGVCGTGVEGRKGEN